MRTLLLSLLGFGVFAGYGSALASARWHAGHHRTQCHAPSALPTGAPPAPPATPQVVVVLPGASPVAAPQVITGPVPAAVAPPTPQP